jgi:hypothetical protein
MHLESYGCELCILQKDESLRHMFVECSFAKKNCWAQIGIQIPSWLSPTGAVRRLRRSLAIPFAMKIIILMCWCIWTERNRWLFNNNDPSVENCRNKFKREFKLVIRRSKERRVNNVENWLNSL